MAELAYQQKALNITPRQRAFQQGLNTLMDAGQMGVQAWENKQNQDQQKSMQSLQFQKELANQGINVTPELQGQINEAVNKNDYGSLGGIFNEGAINKANMLKQEKEALRQQKQAEQDYSRQLDQRKYAMEQQRFVGDQDYRNQQLENQRYAIDQKNAPMGAEQKIGKLGAEGRSKVGSIVSGLEAIDKMGTAIEKGYDADYITSETPLIGGFISDNPFTESQRVLTEVVGRLQSGGAINKDEEKRFYNMGPRAGDSAQTQRRKLANQKEFLRNKLTAFGINEQELPQIGFNYKPSSPTNLSPSQQGGFSSNAYANDAEMIIQPERSQARIDRINFLKQKAQGLK